jgi:hypothetical protein
MSILFSDSEIDRILQERKKIGSRQFARLKRAAKGEKHGNFKKPVDLKTKSGRRLRLRISLNERDKKQFSIILSYVKGKSEIPLVRCNGHHGPHTNRLEKRAKRGIAFIPQNTFHIHIITERYQNYDKNQTYAEPTTEYHSAESALEYMCNHFFISKDYKKYHPLLE